MLRDLVSMVHSLAVLEQPAPTFLEAARQLVQPRLAAASGRDLTDLLWGFAKLGVPTPAAFLDLCTVHNVFYSSLPSQTLRGC